MPAGRHKKGETVSTQKKNKKVFVNRTKAREAFKREYENVKNSGMEDWSMLYFSGVGGIGKSELLRRFKIDNGLTDAEIEKSGKYCLTYDFQNSSSSTLDILVNWRNILVGNYPKKFRFRDFDLAMLIYYEKNGMSSELRDVAQSWAESPLFGAFEDANDILNSNQDLVEALSALPGVNAVLKGFKLVTHLSNIAQNQVEKKRIEDIKTDMSEEMSYQDTVELIVDYFAENLAECTEKLDEPLVMIIDTYENYVNKFSASFNVYIDEWLYRQIISYASGILWVIAGREELLWPWEEMGFEEKPEELLFKLKELDEDYIYEYLADMEVDEKYYQPIKDNSKGNPLWMQLSAEGCLKAQELGQEFDFTNITTSEVLVERYLRYMDDARADFIKQLALIGSWSDEDVLSTLIRGYNATTYEKIKEACFVRSEGNTYYMHELMREVVCSICHKKGYSEIKYLNDRVWQYGLTGFDEDGKLEGEDVTFGLEEKKQRLIFMIKYGTYNMVDTWDQDIMCNAADEFWEIDRTRDFMDVADVLRDYKASIQGEEDGDTIGYGMMVAYVKTQAGVFDEALSLYEKIIEIRKRLSANIEEDISILNTQTGIVECLGGLKKYQEAVELGEYVFNKLTDLEGEGDEDTLDAMIALVGCKYALDNKDGIEFAERTLKTLIEYLGEDDAETISMRTNLATYYALSGLSEKTEKHLEETFNIYRELYGDDDEITKTSGLLYSSFLRNVGKIDKAQEIEALIGGDAEVGKSGYLDEDGIPDIRVITKCNTLIAEEQYEEALEIYRELIKELEQTALIDSATLNYILMIKASMMPCLVGLGLYEEGEAIGDEILEELITSYTSENVISLGCMSNLAWCKVGLKKNKEAGDLFNHLAHFQEKAAGKLTADSVENRYNGIFYGLVKQGIFSKALPEVIHIIPLYEKYFGKCEPETLGVLSIAVQLCNAVGAYDLGLKIGKSTIRDWIGENDQHPIDNPYIKMIFKQIREMEQKQQQ